jgi:predicted dithiol-disulfide oxidoreductase (DUF899 family)
MCYGARSRQPTKEPTVNLPEVVSPAEWQSAHEELLAKEKQSTRERDALAAERRRQPMARLEKPYEFEGPEGSARLIDLFEGRRQLIVYHFMFGPNVEGWPEAGCTGCTMFTDQIGRLAHLHARDTSFALVSRAPLDNLLAYRERMGWEPPWYSSEQTDFDSDLGVRRGFGLSVFIRDDDGEVFRTYFTSGRGVEALGSVWTFLDLTPLGRQEEWEDTPAGRPQTPPYSWWQRHDEYAEAVR